LADGTSIVANRASKSGPIPSTERDHGNVFQTTIRGRWDSPGVFHCITGERLIVDAD